jgi:hypothetical protein
MQDKDRAGWRNDIALPPFSALRLIFFQAIASFQVTAIAGHFLLPPLFTTPGHQVKIADLHTENRVP